MRFAAYRTVLAAAAFRRLMIIAFFIRIPTTMAGIAVTFYVVQDLHRGYGAAGLVVMASTIGTMLGGPFLGRLIDRRGLRTTLVLTTVGEATLWFVAPALSFSVLLPFVAIVCVLRLPIFSIVKQAITVLVPEEQRRQAFALDSMSVELSFMIGPALAAFLVTQYSGKVTFLAIGVAMVISCVSMLIINPPVTVDAASQETAPVSTEEATKNAGVPWLGRAILVQFALAGAAMLALAGTDVSLVAALRSANQVEWTGVVFAVWCGASLIGGFVFGTVRRPIAPALVIGLLTALTIPVGLAGDWRLLSLSLIPCGLFCAPALTASSDAVTRLAPPGSVGEVFGWHGAATTVGSSLGAPLAGAVIDRTTAAGGFAAVGGIGLAVVLLVLVVNKMLDFTQTGEISPPTTPTQNVPPPTGAGVQCL